MIGKTLSHYQITAELGSGGMGEVYRARDTRLRRDVAVKVLPTRVAQDAARRARFEQEARAVAALSHPNVVTIFDYGVEQGTVFAVMELLEGRSLAEELRERGALPVEEALRHASRIAEGLSAAHRKGILHRDLKPANVFLTRDGATKILDFGLAKILEPHTDDVTTPITAPETAAGAVFGTPGYMAPERVRGERGDERADIFAWGLMLHEMLTGRNPFLGSSAPETMSAILRDEAPDLTTLGYDAELANLVRESLAKDPRRRPASVQTVIERLAARSPAPAADDDIDTLAVLPFHNEADDEDADYLIDGLTDLLIDNLSQLPRLKVMARSTVFRCRDLHDRPDQVGRELGVRAVLTGRLQRHRDALRIRAELVDATDGSRLWGGRFDRKVTDLLTIEEELCGEITDKLRFRLSHEEIGKITKRHTENPLAHEAYLQGRFFWNRWKTPEAMRTAIGFFERALELDPLYARAYAGLADSYNMLGNVKALPPGEAYPKAKTAAEQGLAIDEGLAELHTSLGFIHRFWDWDWAASRRQFERALELNPGYAPAHRFYGHLLIGLGRFDEALARVKRALELDPLSLIIHTAVGDALFYAGRYEESMVYYRKTLEIDEGFLPGHTDLARSLELAGRHEEAIEEFQLAQALAPKGPPEPSSGLAHVYAQMGRREEALAILEELKASAVRRYVSPYGIASIYACLGDLEASLDWLEKAYREHDQTLVWVKVHPRLRVLHGHPRYEDLLRRMNLVDPLPGSP